MRKLVLISISLFLGATLNAQIEDFEDTEHHRKVFKSHTDSTIRNIKDFVTHGVVSGNIRNYSMATINQGDFYDYFANAWGGRLGYTTAEFHGFQVGVQGIFVFNVASNDITRKDPVAEDGSRYERQLFDLEDEHNRRDLDRLEELFLYYNFGNSYFEIGKLNKKTPLLNPQDSRMKPYVFEGIWGDIRELSNVRFELGYFWRASPRSVTDWYNINDAIGIYDNGYFTDGTEAEYEGRLVSGGIGVLGTEFILSDQIKGSVWEYYLDNIVNTAIGQIDLNKNNWIAGVQYLRQDPIGNGGMVADGHGYYDLSHRTNLVSSRAGYKFGNHILTLNYTHIASTGRFVFPREFGREQLYSTIPRMRLEGLGNTHAGVIRYRFSPEKNKNLVVRLEAGVAKTPGPDNFELNKYNTPSFAQGVTDIYYRPKNIWKGLSFRLLYVYRQNLEEYDDPELIFNTSNFHHLNFITNISF